jgi:hypothetical protein
MMFADELFASHLLNEDNTDLCNAYWSLSAENIQWPEEAA